MSRINRTEYFMNITKLVAQRSTCPRAAVGCIIVADNQIVGTGYNGAPSGVEHCKCEMLDEHCKRTIHAEANAVIRLQMVPKSLAAYGPMAYCTHEPCWECTKLLYTIGVRQIVYIEGYLARDYKDLRQSIFKDLEVLAYDKAI